METLSISFSNICVSFYLMNVAFYFIFLFINYLICKMFGCYRFVFVLGLCIP